MQDIEFTVQEGKLYMLQCRNGKRTGAAAVRIAVELVDEKLLTPEQALLKVCVCGGNVCVCVGGVALGWSKSPAFNPHLKPLPGP